MFTGDGFVDTGAEGDCSFWAASQDLEGWRVVLLVRDPRYVIGSWLNTGEFEMMLGRGYSRLWQHCRRIDPAIVDYEGAERIEQYWSALNTKVARRADVVLRLEETTPEILGEVCGQEWRDVPHPESTTEPVELVDKWAKAAAREFGYDG